MRHSNELRDRRRGQFLETLRAGHTIRSAAKAAGVARATVYRWRESDAAFAEPWDNAEAESLAVLEDKAFELAMAGSERMLMFLLRARDPQTYRERGRADPTPDEEQDHRLAGWAAVIEAAQQEQRD